MFLCSHIDAHIYNLFILRCLKKEGIHQDLRANLGSSFQKFQSVPYHHVSLAKFSLCSLLPDQAESFICSLAFGSPLVFGGKRPLEMLTGSKSSSMLLRSHAYCFFASYKPGSNHKVN